MRRMKRAFISYAIMVAVIALGGMFPVSSVMAGEADRSRDVASARAGGAAAASPGFEALPADTGARVQGLLGQLPLYFIENRGQMDEEVAYYVQGRDTSLYFTSTGLTFALTAGPEKEGTGEPAHAEERSARLRAEADEIVPVQRWVVKLDFVGGNQDVGPVGRDQTEAVISYFKGRPDQWRAGLPTYSRLVYPDLWPGIDLVYSGRANELKYEFMVRPGADPGRIRLAYRGATAVTLDADGGLEVETPLGGIRDAAPVVYQEIGGQRVMVDAAYHLAAGNDGGAEYGFQLGRYDLTQPLIIDPVVIAYCGYIGGSGDDHGYRIAVDGAGNAYVAGGTYSSEASFPVTVGPDLTHNGGGDAFVAKVGADGTGLVYCGYIGGSDWDQGYDIAVDGAGNAYVAGGTHSSEASFPVTLGPDLTHNGGGDAFVAKVRVVETSYLPVVMKNYVCTPDPYEPNDQWEDAYLLASNTTLPANFCEEGIKDEYTFSISNLGTAIVIDLTSIPSGCDYDLYLYRDSDRVTSVARSDNDGNANEHIAYNPTVTGQYYVLVYARVKGGQASSSNYQLQCTFQ